MRSVGIDLAPYVDKGLLVIHSSRPTLNGLEMHLVTIHKMIKVYKPQAVIIDPISNLITTGQIGEVRSMLTRLIDFLKVNGITALFTALTVLWGNHLELTEEGVSSLVDTWITLRDMEGVGERNRGLSILKSGGWPIQTRSASLSLPIRALSCWRCTLVRMGSSPVQPG